MIKRVFIIVLDSFGVGKAKDAKDFGDEGADTLASVSSSDYFKAPNLTSAGLFNIDNAAKGKNYGAISNPIGSYGRLNEESKGKDSTVGHWELAGLVSHVPFPLFPEGFPDEIISEFEKNVNDENEFNKIVAACKASGISKDQTKKLLGELGFSEKDMNSEKGETNNAVKTKEDLFGGED